MVDHAINTVNGRKTALASNWTRMTLPYQTLKVSDHRKTSQRNITQRSEIQIVTSQAFPATSTTQTIV